MRVRQRVARVRLQQLVQVSCAEKSCQMSRRCVVSRASLCRGVSATCLRYLIVIGQVVTSTCVTTDRCCEY